MDACWMRCVTFGGITSTVLSGRDCWRRCRHAAQTCLVESRVNVKGVAHGSVSVTIAHVLAILYFHYYTCIHLLLHLDQI